MIKLYKTGLATFALLLVSSPLMGEIALAQSSPKAPSNPKASELFKPKTKPVPQTNPLARSNRVNPAVELKTQQATVAHQAICARHTPQLNDGWYPSFDWSTPARYGHDRKVYRDDAGKLVGNGIIDLPNTLDYVRNTQSYSNNPADACPCSGPKCEPRFRINLKADGHRANYTQLATTLRSTRAKNNCPALDFPDRPQPSYHWRINGASTATLDDNGASVCLPEGHHDVTLSMTYNVSGKTRSQFVTRKIEVIDHLIVNLGDSYGAGEGVPEKNFWPENMPKTGPNNSEVFDVSEHFVQQRTLFDQWADPGIAIPRIDPVIPPITQDNDNRLYAYSKMNEVKRQADGKTIKFYQSDWNDRTHRIDLTGWEPDWEIIREHHNTTYRMLMNHQAAHRSSAAAASQLALHLESRDNKSSVTFLNLAASGATIDKGVLGRYNGVEDIKSPTNPTKYRPRDRRGNVGLEPQVEELEYLLGDRSADSVYLSVGGNDVGFANIITIFLTAFDGDSERMDSTVQPMLRALDNGRWSSTDFGGLAARFDAYATFDDTIGLINLRDGYERLNTALSELNISGDINLIGYPNFSTSTRNDTHDWTDDAIVKSSTHGTNYCNLHVKAASDPHLSVNLDFDPIEFKVADKHIFTPLFEEMTGAVDDINRKNGKLTWNFIDQGIEPGRHGICGWGPYKNTTYMARHFDGAYSFKQSNNGDPTKPADILTHDTADADHYKWYRTPQDGAAIQHGFTTSNKGMFHPNEYGYRHAARMMMKALKPYGAELEVPNRLAYLHHNDRGQDRFSDADDSIVEATETVGRKPGDNQGVLTQINDVKMFKFIVDTPRCTPVTINLKPSKKLYEPLSVRVYSRNGNLIAASDTRSTGKDPFAIMDERVEPIRGLTTQNPRLEKFLAVNTDTPKVEDVSERGCSLSDYRSIPGNTQTVLGSEVSFLKQYPNTIYVAVSHRQNTQFDPITGRGDIRIDQPTDTVSFELDVEANSSG